MKYFIDFEATDDTKEIIHVGCVKETGEEFQSLVKFKEGTLSPWVIKDTHITDEFLQNAPSSEEVFKKLFDFIGKDVEAQFYCWGNDDKTFIKSTFNYCLDYQAKLCLGYIGAGMRDYAIIFADNNGLANPRNLYKTLNCIDSNSTLTPHNALDDARALKQIYEYVQNTESKERLNVFHELRLNNRKKEVNKKDKPDSPRIYAIDMLQERVYSFKNSKRAAVFCINCRKNNGLVKTRERKRANKDIFAKRVEEAICNQELYLDLYWEVDR